MDDHVLARPLGELVIERAKVLKEVLLGRGQLTTAFENPFNHDVRGREQRGASVRLGE